MDSQLHESKKRDAAERPGKAGVERHRHERSHGGPGSSQERPGEAPQGGIAPEGRPGSKVVSLQKGEKGLAKEMTEYLKGRLGSARAWGRQARGLKSALGKGFTTREKTLRRRLRKKRR